MVVENSVAYMNPFFSDDMVASVAGPVGITNLSCSRIGFLEGHCPAEFSSNPDQTHLSKLIKVFRITRNSQQ